MIDCKMGISADTLVLVHSSTKVSNIRKTKRASSRDSRLFTSVLQSVAWRTMGLIDDSQSSIRKT